MNITKLINTLNYIKSKHGEIDIAIMYDSGAGRRNIESILVDGESICYISDIPKSYMHMCFNQDELSNMKEILINE